MEKKQAEQLLRRAVGNPAARFHEGQWEAIDALVNKRRKMIVVQRTGWGKSSVYFISTRILRDQGAGPTIIISPLLALMRNQIEAADRLGVHAETINSTNSDEWDSIKQRVFDNEIDALLVSPERLSNEKFVDNLLLPIASKIGLLVVDEAHCISDWGHDFRPDYRRITNILQHMPSNMPVLGTTATANNRVINDIHNQFGDVEIQRGTLVRESLYLQTINNMSDQSSRLAWLAHHIPELPGTGIIYVLTQRDAKQVARWLNMKGITAAAYFSGATDDNFFSSDKYRQHLEEKLLNNRIKALVATTALGMGYDKPDLGFVVHYQAPSSVISYYQQVGRAGRAIDQAYGILLSGGEDDQIQAFFRENAFPSEEEVHEILDVLEEHDGLSIIDLQRYVNLRKSQIEKVVKILSVENPAPLIKQGSHWFRTPVEFNLDEERIEHLTHQRQIEWEEVQSYIESTSCLMAYLRNSLDDPESEECGQCAICQGRPLIPESIDHDLTIEAGRFLRHAEIPFKPKIQVAKGAFSQYGFRGNLPEKLRASEGRILSRWKDAGWGAVVAADKSNGHFGDNLVEAVAEMVEKRWKPDPSPQWVTAVPSLNNPNLVPDYAQRLADRLGLPFVDAIQKINQNQPQKLQQNRYHQCQNLDGVFSVSNYNEEPVLLVDDVIDSGWTVTVLAALLRSSGSGQVFPVALSTTAQGM